MNLKKNIIAGAVTLALLAFTTGNLPAAGVNFTNLVTVSASFETQGVTNISNGTGSASIVKIGIANKQLLAWLAVDEHAEGNFSSTNFPAGAILVVIVNSSDSSADFQVLSKTGVGLVDVSDIVSASHGSDSVASFKVSGQTGLFDPSADQLRVFNFFFNDTELPGDVGLGISFYMSGIESKTVSDTAPKSGFYTETVSTKVAATSGDGTFLGAPIVVTGSLGFSGKAVLPF